MFFLSYHIEDLMHLTETDIDQIHTRASGPGGSLPLTDQMLRQSPSGDLFGLSQNVCWNGMATK